jgi:hypothetical protein
MTTVTSDDMEGNGEITVKIATLGSGVWCLDGSPLYDQWFPSDVDGTPFTENIQTT